MVINKENNTITLEIGTDSAESLLGILKAEVINCRSKLINLKRIENDERENGRTTWWSSGCKVSPNHAANIMYDAMEKWASLEDMIKQIEEIKKLEEIK